MTCPLCLSPETKIFDQDKLRSYYQCSLCSLVFVPRNELISTGEEKKRYESHENNEDDPHYRQYLVEIVESIVPFISEGASGLDFGCGKTRLMEILLNERGFVVDSFDIFFHPETEPLDKKFDFIILSEVIEHLRNPHTELRKLASLLNSGGHIFIKTKLLPTNKTEFSEWFYKRDRTHVQFFSEDTFLAREELFGLRDGKRIGKDLFSFRHN